MPPAGARRAGSRHRDCFGNLGLRLSLLLLDGPGINALGPALIVNEAAGRSVVPWAVKVADLMRPRTRAISVLVPAAGPSAQCRPWPPSESVRGWAPVTEPPPVATAKVQCVDHRIALQVATLTDGALATTMPG